MVNISFNLLCSHYEVHQVGLFSTTSLIFPRFPRKSKNRRNTSLSICMLLDTAIVFIVSLIIAYSEKKRHCHSNYNSCNLKHFQEFAAER